MQWEVGEGEKPLLFHVMCYNSVFYFLLYGISYKCLGLMDYVEFVAWESKRNLFSISILLLLPILILDCLHSPPSIVDSRSCYVSIDYASFSLCTNQSLLLLLLRYCIFFSFLVLFQMWPGPGHSTIYSSSLKKSLAFHSTYHLTIDNQNHREKLPMYTISWLFSRNT